MAYNFYPANYQPIYYPQQNNYQPQQTNYQPQQGNLIWVQGEAGAKSYMVAPNSTVTLWDSEAQTIYIKSADASGMPSIRTLDYTIRGNVAEAKEAVNYATKDDLTVLKGEIDDIKKAISKKGKE